MTFDEALASLPIIAIVRGVEPDQAVSIGEALYDQGVRAMEVPLNSPEPLESIRHLATRFGGQMLIGAGTVLSSEQVASVKAVGGQFIVSPNTDAAVIGASLALGLDALPGFSTPTEAFAAIAAGARFLKLFPASSYGSAHVKAIRAVLPQAVKIIAVGGIGQGGTAPWLEAGVNGFGLGSELYRPGFSPDEVGKRTAACVATLGR